jgi:hypothetical protein
MGEREVRLATTLLKESNAGEKNELKAKDCRAFSIFTQASEIVAETGGLQFDNDSLSYFIQTGFVPIGSNGTKIGLRGYVLNNERPNAKQLRSNIYVLTQEERKEPEKIITINKSQCCVNLDRQLKEPTEYKKLKKLLDVYSKAIGFNPELTVKS